MGRIILHVDMDAYFASVEEISNPFLKGKPVLVAGDPETRTTVSTANYQARKYGIKSGMPLKQALRLCPDAEIVVGDFAKYLSATARLFEIFKQFTPFVELYSIDEAFLDITGTMHLFGGAEAAAVKIKEKIKDELGLTCSVGISPNKLLSKLASDTVKPDGLTVIKREDVPALFKDLPVEKLWGIGEKLALKLNSLGIRTCRELGDYPVEELTDIFGVNGSVLHSMGRGEYSSEVKLFCHQEECKSMGHSYTLFRDTSNPVLVQSTLYRLCEQVGRRLRKDGYRGKTVTLVVRFSDFETLVRQKSVQSHTDDGGIVYGVALSVMNTFRVKKPVRLVGVSVSNLIKGQESIPLFERDRKRELLMSAADRINDRFGEFTVSPGPVLMEKALAAKRPERRGLFLNKGVVK